jgi:putative salt-induced outer membrane protein
LRVLLTTADVEQQSRGFAGWTLRAVSGRLRRRPRAGELRQFSCGGAFPFVLNANLHGGYMHHCFRHSGRLVFFVATSIAASVSLAQPKVVQDGRWRANIGLAASYASGNTESTNLSLKAAAVRATAVDKITANARALHGETDGTQTAAQYGLGGRYDYNVSAKTYAFGQADYLRDEMANLKMRLSGASGIGYRMIDEEKQKFEVYAGLGYSHEEYFDPSVVADELRTSYGYAEAVLGEESTHQLTDSTKFRQKLVLYPNLSDPGEFRSEFDAGIAVAINRTMDLTVGVNYRYNSDPGTGLDKFDLLVLTGVAIRIE